MNKTLKGCFLFLLTFSVSTSANELQKLKVNFGGDAYVRGYSTKPNSNQKTQGFAQLFRLKMDLKNEDGISLHTRTVLSGNKWNGDVADGSIDGNSTNTGYGDGGNPVRLDYAYLNVPIANGWNARLGRQEAEFAECFNLCDDRRDRLMLYKYYKHYVPIFIFDKRKEGEVTLEGDDGDMYAFTLYHFHQTHEWAVLYAYLANGDDTYIFNKVHNFSPYYKYKSEKLTAFVTWSWIGAGSNNSYYFGSHNSAAARAEYRFHSNFDFSLQGIVSDNGAFIGDGYDSYSFVVNNNPDYNQSNTNLIAIGGLGTATGGDKDNEHFIVSRLRYLKDKLTVSFAAGLAREYVLTDAVDYDLSVYDLQARYQFTKSLGLRAGLALVRGDLSEEATLFQADAKF